MSGSRVQRGLSSQRLEVDRDVPASTQLLDALFFSDVGPTDTNPNGTLALPGTIGLYERAAGILWSRTDPTSAQRDTRRQRELVVTWNCWLGSYIYAFDWIFNWDGSLEVNVKLTGTTLNRGVDASAEPSAHTQHFLNFRLDLDVDGPKNQVMEMEVAHLADTGFKNSFGAVTQRLASEGYRDVDPFTSRHWHVESSTAKNGFGKPTGYALEPEAFAVPYSAPDYPGLVRAQFALHQLWMTRFRDNEQYAAGLFPNRARDGSGIAQFTTPAEPLDGQDVVLWYTTGFTHISRPEDYPGMPSETIGFRLAPRGFFARNPALEVSDHGALR